MILLCDHQPIAFIDLPSHHAYDWRLHDSAKQSRTNPLSRGSALAKGAECLYE